MIDWTFSPKNRVLRQTVVVAVVVVVAAVLADRQQHESSLKTVWFVYNGAQSGVFIAHARTHAQSHAQSHVRTIAFTHS